MSMIKKPITRGLHIIIVGCGKVGTTLVEQLSREGHDITIIDQDAAKVQEIANFYDIMGVETVPATALRWRLVLRRQILSSPLPPRMS